LGQNKYWMKKGFLLLKPKLYKSFFKNVLLQND
jgi:hypothetical protein